MRARQEGGRLRARRGAVPRELGEVHVGGLQVLELTKRVCVGGSVMLPSSAVLIWSGTQVTGFSAEIQEVSALELEAREDSE